MDERYREHAWPQDHPELPFATLVRVIATYCHPEVLENDESPYDALAAAARDPGPPPSPAFSGLRIFKVELRRALSGEWYPRHDVSRESGHDEGSPDAFLRRVWQVVYPDEPVPGGASS